MTDAKGNVSNKPTFSLPVAAAPTGSIAGEAFIDTNANGKLDTGEKPLANVKLYIDANNNGKLDTVEKPVTSSATGTFTLTGLAAGTYVLREVLPAGYKLTAPAVGFISVKVATSTTAVKGELFANAPATASIAGRVFNDINGNGLVNTGEAGLAKWTVYLDANNDGKLDTGDTSVLTDASGNFTFTGLTAGTDAIRVLPKAGFAATKPTNGLLTIKLIAGQKSTGSLFGEKT